ncbi:MAG: hydrogenase 4 subunit B [Magnetococcales bacterium]|nr:hydrogenase 4 subunit B [Magnetococcales bacterium]
MQTLLLAQVGLLAAGILGGLPWGRRPHLPVHGLIIVCAALTLSAVLPVLTPGGAPDGYLLPPEWFWGRGRFQVDALSAFFLTVFSTVVIAVEVYALGYGERPPEPRRRLFFYPLFLLGMNVVVLADDAFLLILGWEFTALASWFLVTERHHETEHRRAAHLFLLTALGGGLALILAFGLLAGHQGGFAFAELRDAASAGREGGEGNFHAALLLTVLGTGTLAGLYPLHPWLPRTLAAAPAHVAALMSGLLPKAAIYVLIRLLFDLAGEIPWGWGAALAAAGGVSAVMGALYALRQSDLNPLLGDHAVSHIGVIVVGLGLALLFRADGLMELSGLALAAALFHTLNHALFNSLLLLGAGAIHTASGQRNLERMGGLIHTLPATAVYFLGGVAAIASLPPFNGFVSQWLTFQALLQTPLANHWGGRVIGPFVGIVLILAGALTVYSFVRVYGVAFLGRPRTVAAAESKGGENPFMRGSMGFLAFLCLALGVFPLPALTLLNRVIVGFSCAPIPWAEADWLLIAPLPEAEVSYSGLLLTAAAVGFTLLATAAVKLIFSTAPVRRADPWEGGRPPSDSPTSQYSASSFAQPARRFFGEILFQARETVELPGPGDASPAAFHVQWRDPARSWFRLADRGVAGAARWMDRLSSFSVRIPLLLLFLTLILLLILTWMSR